MTDTLDTIRAIVGATETEDLAQAVNKRIDDLLVHNSALTLRARAAEQVLATDCRLQHTVDEIIGWQAQTFPGATLQGAVNHLRREMDEVYAATSRGEERAIVAEELGDMVFLIVQALTLLNSDLATILAFKLRINKARKWKKPDADGVVEHVKGPQHLGQGVYYVQHGDRLPTAEEAARDIARVKDHHSPE